MSDVANDAATANPRTRLFGRLSSLGIAMERVKGTIPSIQPVD